MSNIDHCIRGKSNLFSIFILFSARRSLALLCVRFSVCLAVIAGYGIRAPSIFVASSTRSDYDE